jgi:hypothetical protein
MSFLDIDTSDVPEPTISQPGEKEIRIVGFIEKEVEFDDGTTGLSAIWNNSKGDPCFMPLFDIPAEPTAKEFNHYFPIPHEGMTEKELHRAKWGIEEFKRCFNLPQQFDLKDAIGNTGWAILKIQSSDDYGDQNAIKKFILPSV